MCVGCAHDPGVACLPVHATPLHACGSSCSALEPAPGVQHHLNRLWREERQQRLLAGAAAGPRPRPSLLPPCTSGVTLARYTQQVCVRVRMCGWAPPAVQSIPCRNTVTDTDAVSFCFLFLAGQRHARSWRCAQQSLGPRRVAARSGGCAHTTLLCTLVPSCCVSTMLLARMPVKCQGVKGSRVPAEGEGRSEPRGAP